MATGLKEVAQVAGVSVQTASDILNCGREHRYDPSTQARVKEVAQEQRYRPQRLGRVLRAQSTGMIGFVTANFSPEDGQLEFYNVYPFLVGMSHHLSTRDYHVGLLEIAEFQQKNERDLPRCLQERFYDSLVIHWGLAEKFAGLMPLLGIPAIWWDAGLFLPHNCLDRDEAEVGRSITSHLIEMGHRRIGFMVGQRSWEQYKQGNPPHYSYSQRYESYCAVLREHGLEEMPVRGYGVPQLTAQMKKHQLTAIVTMSTASVPYVRLAAHKLGLRMPQDLSVAVCDFEERVRQTEMSVGGVSYDRYAVGRQAAEMLLELLTRRDRTVASAKFVGEFCVGDTISRAPVR
jgi:LacI family transcriptional regulator